jgi:inositol-phosphate phosphatase/L-galactose 1-phosphate phosphatase
VNELARLAADAARRAGAVILNGFEKPHVTTLKGRRELVTEVDSASEDIIIGAIRDECPDDLIIAEETSP